jgi:hypothetical protein
MPARDPRRPDEDRPEGVLGEPGALKDILDRQGAPGHIRGVLEEAGVAGHEGRRREAKDLPEGEVPGHDGEHHPEGIVADVALAGVGLDVFRREVAGRRVCVVIAAQRALLDLRPAAGDRLSHLEGRQPGILVPPFSQDTRCSPHEISPLGEGGLPPGERAGVDGRQRSFELGLLPLFVDLDTFFRGGIDRLHHGAILLGLTLLRR